MSKCFDNGFRSQMFNEIKSLGCSISNSLIGIVQNEMPISFEDMNTFNESVENCIKRLENIKRNINDEFEKLQ